MIATKTAPFTKRFAKAGSSTAKPPKKPKKTQRPPSTTGEGTVIQSGAAAAGRWAVYALAVLMALGALCGFLAFTRPAAQVPQSTATGITPAQQEAGALAQSYLGAWLSATGNDHAGLDQYTDQLGSSLTGKDPIEYRDLAVASVQEAPGDLTTVIVSASIKTTGKDGSGEETTAWTPYWYQIAVQSTDEKLTPVGLPAPVAMPTIGAGPQLGYPSRVANEDVRATVADFMSAYITGQGDVTRFVSPDTTITAITPAYWTQAKVKTLHSAQDVADTQPVDGQSAEVLAQIDLTREGTTKPAQYVLGMTVRDGRWEVQSLKSAPALTE